MDGTVLCCTALHCTALSGALPAQDLVHKRHRHLADVLDGVRPRPPHRLCRHDHGYRTCSEESIDYMSSESSFNLSLYLWVCFMACDSYLLTTGAGSERNHGICEGGRSCGLDRAGTRMRYPLLQHTILCEDRLGRKTEIMLVGSCGRLAVVARCHDGSIPAAAAPTYCTLSCPRPLRF